MTANVENTRLLPYAVIQKAADGNVDSFHRTGFGKSTIGLISGQGIFCAECFYKCGSLGWAGRAGLSPFTRCNSCVW